jgi:hypothetical protein
MKRCTYCGRENADDFLNCLECGTPVSDNATDASRQGVGAAVAEVLSDTFRALGHALKVGWLVSLLGLVVVAIVGLLLLPASRKASAPRVVVLATLSSNGEQIVTFRPEPATAEITYADVVSAAVDANAQPQTTRSFGLVFPVRSAGETNYSLHYIASPFRTLAVPGRPAQAYTPGSYTVAYRPTESGCRVRVGVALPRKGIGDYAGRLCRLCEQRRLAMLWMKSYQDPIFVVFDPFTDAMHGSR